MWVIRGRIVALANDRSVAPTEGSVFTGRVWIDDRGRIAAVTKGTRSGPPEFADAPSRRRRQLAGHARAWSTCTTIWPTTRCRCGPSPARPCRSCTTTPGPRAQSYARKHDLARVRADHRLPRRNCWPTSRPRRSSAAPPRSRVRRRRTGPATAGWSATSRTRRSARGTPNRIYASVLTAKPAALADRANKMRAALDVHLPLRRGPTPGSDRGPGVHRRRGGRLPAGRVRRGARQRRRTRANWPGWRTAGAIAWSPFSNLWLYGETTDVPAARDAGIKVCLGSDWAPSGTKHVLGELKVGSARRGPPGLGPHRPGTGDDGDLPPRRRAGPRPGAARSAGCSPAPRPTWW